MFVMKSFPLLLIANFLYGSAMSSSAIFGGSRSVPSSKRLTDRALPPLVPPKLVEDDEDFDERDLDLSPAHHVQLRPSYWAPTLETLAPEEAEFYRKALVSAMIGSRPQMKRGEAGRSMSMLRMGRASDGGVRRRSTSTDGVRRSMTMLRMGRANFDQDQQRQQQEDEEEAAAKRSMGMLRMGRGATTEEDFRKSMSMLRMGRGAMLDEDNEDLLHQQQQMKRSMGMLRMGRSLGSSQEEENAAEEEESKRSMGMLRMGRALASKNVDRGALNMLRMGKREAMADDQIGSSSGVAAAADKSSSSS